MRREPITLLDEVRPLDGGDLQHVELLGQQAEALSADAAESATGGVELGRGAVRVRIKYTAGVAAVEDRLKAARFRGRQWQIESTDRDHQRMTLFLVKS